MKQHYRANKLWAQIRLKNEKEIQKIIQFQSDIKEGNVMEEGRKVGESFVQMKVAKMQ